MSNYAALAKYIKDRPTLPKTLSTLTAKLNTDKVNVSVFGYPDLLVEDPEYAKYQLTIEDVTAATTLKTVQEKSIVAVHSNDPTKFYVQKGWL